MSQQPKSVSVLTLGKMNDDGRKIYITNKALHDTFPVGQKVCVDYNKETKEVRVTPAEFLGGTHTISSKGNGTPVLDIKNQKVAETLGRDIEKVEVLFFEKEIVIKVSKTEVYKAQRKNKTGLNTFELFSGAGTLSAFFKEAGFNIKGGLELDEDYLALFHENNAGDSIYSINGRLEDIHTSYFPKDIDVVLSGIPCTTYSGSNVKLKTAQKAKREGRPYDEAEIEKEYAAESLTFYVLTAIRTMNPKTVVVEEVVEYSESTASMMLRTVLKQMGYKINETVSSGSNTKRQRWVLVADMEKEVNLESLVNTNERKIGEFLETSNENRDWKPKDQFAPSRLNESIGIRSCTSEDFLCNTFTTHFTRGTEPILKHPELELYSEFTNREIANIHGLPKSFILDERKSISRQILGQGVTDMFLTVANRIKGETEAQKLRMWKLKAPSGAYDYFENETECLTIANEILEKKGLPLADSINSAHETLNSFDNRFMCFELDLNNYYISGQRDFESPYETIEQFSQNGYTALLSNLENLKKDFKYIGVMLGSKCIKTIYDAPNRPEPECISYEE